MRTGLAAALLGVCLGAGCVGPFAAPTPEACPDALLEGELLADDAAGLMVRHAEGFVMMVVWPDGYTVRDADVRELLDPAGQVVAREGDHVWLGGGMNAAGTAFIACGGFRVVPG